MSGTGQRLRLRLFLEGVEVPVIAANVQAMPNSPAAASIQIPPLADGTRFLPRTLVHLFFLDFYDGLSPHVTHRGPSAPKAAQSPTTYEQALEAAEGVEDIKKELANDRYKLLFGGEVVGFQWSKNASNRSLVLQCQDWSNYWDYAYQWNNTDLFGPGVKAIFSGGGTSLFTDFLSDEGSEIIKIIQTPSVQYPQLKGLLGGIVHLLEAIGGSYYYGKQFAGENNFFSFAELRLHITQMITAYEKDPTASRLLNADAYDSLFGRTLGGLGQQVSIRQAINALMGIIFHETYAIPTPLYVPSSSGGAGGGGRKAVRKDEAYAFIANTADDLILEISNIDAFLLAAFDQDKAVVAANQATLLARLRAVHKISVQTMTRITAPPVKAAKAFYAGAAAAVSKALTMLRTWMPGTSDKIVAAARALFVEVKKQLARASEFEMATSTKNERPARLNQQIFRPDVWFSAPPRCNVLFPEHYTSLSYQRTFMTEPTRLLLKTNDEFFGEDELFDQFYVTPRATRVKKGDHLSITALFENDILDHELFTGILPVFEKMGELNIFGARSGTVPGKGNGGKQPKIGLAQRSANFLYYKYRFASRQMSVSARFNPYVVPGFPGLIIDKYIDPNATARRQELIQQAGGKTNPDLDRLLGTHFLANFTEVVHSIDQASGRTDLNCSYARQPEESTEFFGIGAEQTVRKRFEKDALRSTDVAALFPPKPFSLGPNYGNITKVTEVTDIYAGAPSTWGAPNKTKGQPLPYYQGPRRTGTGEPRVSVPIGLAQAAKEYGEEVAKIVGNRDQIVMFRAFRLEEEVPRYRREIVDLPAEEYIRPGWYGDCWHPAMIGQVYQDFFQTGAITDHMQIGDADGASIGVPEQEVVDALAEAAQGLSFDDPRKTAPALLALDRDSSIQSAVGFIVHVYSYIRAGGLDVDEFIRSYTWRPIATMVDMFGSSDLTLSADGHQVLQGIEGFHSRAFGPFDDLFGLVRPDIEGILGIKRGSPAAQRGDVRKRRQDAVLEYVSSLQYARAILG
jgi:hypothetical protein